MATEERLTDQYNAWIARHLSANQVKMMAVIYMKIEQSTLENISSGANGDQEDIIRELFRIWRNKTSATTQDLGNILHDAEIIDTEKIEEILKVQPQEFKFIPETREKLAEWELGWLAKKIGPTGIRTLAQNCFGESLSSAQIQNFQSNHPGDAWNVSFDILVQWNRKTKNSRRMFLTYLEANSDISEIEELDLIFGRLRKSSQSESGAAGGEDLREDFDLFKKKSKKQKLDKGEDQSKTKSEQDYKKNTSNGVDELDAKSEDTADGKPEHPVVSPGYLLIINNNDFGGNSRDGSQADVAALKKEFEKRGFIPILLENLSAKMMIAAVKTFARKDKLETLQKRKDFKKQFQLHVGENMKELEEFFNELSQDHEKGKQEVMKEFADNYSLNLDDAQEFENGFETSRREALKNIFMFKLDKKQKLNLEKEDENVGRKAFVNKYNLSKIEELDKLITKFRNEAKKPLIETGSLVVALMSHGNRGTIQGIDGKRVEIDVLLNEFNTDNCPGLAGKEKMFLVQSCRGPDLDTVQEDDAGESTGEAVFDFREIEAQVIPRYADMIAGYATSYGLKALRYTLSGSVFIEKVCDVIKELGDEDDVLTITTEINKRVAGEKHKVKKDKDSTEKVEVVQMCEFHHTLRRKWFLPKRN